MSALAKAAPTEIMILPKVISKISLCASAVIIVFDFMNKHSLLETPSFTFRSY
jgi:hypothetical protein